MYAVIWISNYGAAHQIDIVKPVVIFAHTSTFEVVRETINSRMQKIEVVLIGEQPGLTVDDLISVGSHSTVNLKKKQFHPGEARRRIAFLCFSSGTTGNPKVSCELKRDAQSLNIISRLSRFRTTMSFTMSPKLLLSTESTSSIHPGGNCDLDLVTHAVGVRTESPLLYTTFY